MSRKAKNRLTGEEQDAVQTVVVVPPHCPSCKSTNRANLQSTTKLQADGEIDGVTYNTVVWSRTHCLDCGQHFIIKTYCTE